MFGFILIFSYIFPNCYKVGAVPKQLQAEVSWDYIGDYLGVILWVYTPQ